MDLWGLIETTLKTEHGHKGRVKYHEIINPVMTHESCAQP